MNYETFMRINVVIRNVLLGLIAFSIAKLTYVLFLLGIKWTEMHKTMELLVEITKALAKKLGIRI